MPLPTAGRTAVGQWWPPSSGEEGLLLGDGRRRPAVTWPAVRRWLAVGAAAAIAGLLAQRLAVPAAWLIGPLLASLLLTLAWHRRADVPSRAYRAAQATIGAVLSASFKPSTL